MSPAVAARRALAVLALTLAAAAVTAAAAPGFRAYGTPTPPARAAAGLRGLHFGARLIDVPVDEAHNPRGLRYIIDFLPTGSVIRRRIMIINQEPRTARFTVYPAAAQITGGIFTGLAGRARSELTGWITVQHPSLTLRPGQSATDLVTIRVPRGATRGEHYGVIWAEQATSVAVGRNVAVRDVARVGIRVYLAVGRGGAPPTTFAVTAVRGQPPTAGPPLLVTHVRNTGGRAIDLTGTLRLAGGPGGSSAGPFASRQQLTLAPGQAGDVVFALPPTLPAGPWTATVTLVSGLTTATARAPVSFGGRTAAVTWASPATLAGGGLLLGLSVIAAVWIARARRPRRALA